jgi:predicted secreted protein
MGHQVSLDDESMLVRAESPDSEYDPLETAANAFATDFLLPQWLLISHAGRHKWTRRDLSEASVDYQLSLRAGASYQATSLALLRHNLIGQKAFEALRQVEVKRLKQDLREGYPLENWYPDVWILTEADEGSTIEGDSRDAFVLRLKENSGAGYLWNIDDLKNAGFLLFRDDRLIPTADEDIGGEVERVLSARPGEGRVGHITLQTDPALAAQRTAQPSFVCLRPAGKGKRPTPCGTPSGNRLSIDILDPALTRNGSGIGSRGPSHGRHLGGDNA